MADNVPITAGTGTDIATDDVGGVQYQRVKATWGPDGTANDTDVASGKPMPVQLRGSDGTDRSNALPVSVASAQIASGAIASGAVASGAYASGAFASGAFAAGSIAAGAVAAGATSIADNEDAASVDGDRGVKILAVRKATPANTSGSDGDYEFLQMSAGLLWTHPIGDFVTVSTDVTRAADTNIYAANDTWANSTSAPTAGGFTFTSAARISGGSGIITDAIVTTSNDPATLLQGEIWIFDSAVTAVNDNAALVVSDTEIKAYVGKIPFAMEDAGNNGSCHVTGLNIGFTAVGTANLRFLVKVKNAYTPANAEVLTVRLKILQTN